MDKDGRNATSPWRMPWTAWKQVALRSWREASDDNIGLVSAGVAFYGFVALVPLLGAIVLGYGIFADPHSVLTDMRALTQVMPPNVAQLIGDQLMQLVQTSDGKKGLGLLVALGLALFGARNGAGAIITALNIAYEEEEKRNFLWVTLTALAITAGAVVGALVAMAAIAALGVLEKLIPGAPGVVLVLGKAVSYLLLAAAGAGGAAALFRYAPSRDRPRWVWISPGSLLASIGWLVLTLGFGIYVTHFGSYDRTYGSLGAVVVLLTWLYLSAYILLFAGELNSELEHQTARDTTTGAAAPLGARNAWAADHVAGGPGEDDAPARPLALPAPDDGTPAARPAGTARQLLAARVTARAARTGGLPQVGLATTSAATLGLALVRRRGRGTLGLALIGAATAVAWLGRHDGPGTEAD